MLGSVNANSHKVFNDNLGVTGTGILPQKPLVKKKSRTGAESRLLGAHPESGVEVDVICAAYVLVLFFCTVQSSDTDGSTPVYKARNGTLSTTSSHPRQHLHEHQSPQ